MSFRVIKYFGLFIVFQEFIKQLLGLQFIQNIDEFIILILFLVTILNGKFRTIKTDKYFITIIIMGFISNYLNSKIDIATFADLIIFSKFYMYFHVVRTTQISKKQTEEFYNFFKILGLLFLFVATMELFFPFIVKKILWGNNLPPIRDIRYGFYGAGSFMKFAGYFGAFMVFCAVLSFSNYLLFGRKVDLFFILIFFLGIIASTRRKSILGFIIAIMIYLLFMNNMKIKNKYLKIFLLILSLAVIFLLFYDLILNIIYSGLFYLQDYDSLDIARNALFIISIVIGLEYFPLGVGFGKFGGAVSFLYYSEFYYKYNLNNVYGLRPGIDAVRFGMDTFWPYVLGEVGIIGLLLFLFIIIYFFKYAKNSLALISYNNKYFAMVVVLLLIAYLPDTFTAPVFSNTYYIYFIITPLGFLGIKK